MQLRNNNVSMNWTPPKSHKIWSARFACLTIMSSTPCGCRRWENAYTDFFVSVIFGSEGLSQGVQTTFSWTLAWQWAGLLKWEIDRHVHVDNHSQPTLFLCDQLLMYPCSPPEVSQYGVEGWCNACPAGRYHSSDDCVSCRSDVHKTAWGM